MVVKCARELMFVIENVLEVPRYVFAERKDLARYTLKDRIKFSLEGLGKCLGEKPEPEMGHLEKAIKYAERERWADVMWELEEIMHLVYDEVLVGGEEATPPKIVHE